MVSNAMRPCESVNGLAPTGSTNAVDVVAWSKLSRASDEDAVDIHPPVLSMRVEVAVQEVAGVNGNAKVEIDESTYAEVIVVHVATPSTESTVIT